MSKMHGGKTTAPPMSLVEKEHQDVIICMTSGMWLFSVISNLHQPVLKSSFRKNNKDFLKIKQSLDGCKHLFRGDSVNTDMIPQYIVSDMDAVCNGQPRPSLSAAPHPAPGVAEGAPEAEAEAGAEDAPGNEAQDAPGAPAGETTSVKATKPSSKRKAAAPKRTPKKPRT